MEFLDTNECYNRAILERTGTDRTRLTLLSHDKVAPRQPLMSRDRRGQIEQLYYSAVELRPSDRRTFLVEACAGDMVLLGEVESLLAQQTSSSVSSEDTTRFAHDPEPTGEQPRPGRRVGVYQLLHLLGMG